ncbi:MAG: hypothetical protein JXR71_08585 [Bacteroidales bacterium]|nr:hypothetical protein [Bacteroidales bacterium]
MEHSTEFDRFQHIPARYFETMERSNLKQQLTLFIRELLEHDFHRLCNLIYRHDVSEPRFQEALELPDMDLQADRIADLVIEREMQKVATRKAYRKFKEDRDQKSLE